jgi:hypothetical protein
VFLIRRPQMEALAKATQAPLLARASAWMAAEFPAETVALGEGRGVFLDTAFSKAATYNLQDEDDLKVLLGAMLVLGPDFDGERWADRLLNDPARDTSLKLILLDRAVQAARKG